MDNLRVNNRPRTMFSMQALNGGITIWLPNPDNPSAENLISTLVNSARNANGIVNAQKIGRDQEKTSMSWNFLSKEEWEELLRFWDENFFFKFTYYSRVKGHRITRVFYIGDRTDTPFDINESGEPIAYRDCKANVVDTGEGE